MSFTMELNIRVQVNNDQEAEKIMEAAFSGLAGEIIRMGVLYGVVPVGGAATGVTASASPDKDRNGTEESRRASEVEVQRASVTSDIKKIEGPAEKASKPVGLAGRKRMGRI